MRVPFTILVALLAAAPDVIGQAKKAPPQDLILYVGTYTRPQKSKGIYAWRFQPATGSMSPIGLVAETASPSFLAVHPNQKFLYAVNEVNTGTVSAFAIEPETGKLKLLNQVSTKGGGPCHLTTDRTGKWLYAANYGTGSVAAFPVHDDGSLGESSAFVQHTGSGANPQRQRGPHAHMTLMAPENRYVFVADLGLDQVLGYPVDANRGGMATDAPVITKIAPGSGPRHMAFRPDGKFLYVLNEILCTVTALRYDAMHGTTEEIQTIPTLPADFTGTKSTAEIAAHRNGNLLYASNRGHDTIAAFRIDSASGKLTLIGHTPTRGKTPRNFAIDPTGAWLFAANQDSDNMSVFRLDAKTGSLSPAGEPVEVFAPVCVVFAAAK